MHLLQPPIYTPHTLIIKQSLVVAKMLVGAGEIADFGFFKLGALLEDTEKENYYRIYFLQNYGVILNY